MSLIMVTTRIALVIVSMLAGRSVEVGIRSVQMSIMNGRRFSCANSTCLPFISMAALDTRECQMACLAQSPCNAASFYPLTHNCQLFADTSNAVMNIVTDPNAITMTTMTGTRTPAISRYTALLLTDAGGAVANLISSLQAAGINSTYTANNFRYYNGTPDAANFGTVILVTGSLSGYAMPLSGQQSILNAQQNNATGVVFTEWAAFQFQQNLSTILCPLQLFTRSSSGDTNITMTLTVPNHPIWTNVSTSFTSTAIISYNKGGSLMNNGTIIANCSQCGGGPGVAVRASPSPAIVGRVVQIAHAGHYYNGVQTFNWTNDINLSTMMINAVKWTANLI